MDDKFLRFVYLTLPTSSEPTLNITLGETHHRYRITREQLFALNAQTADALLRGEVKPWHASDQLALPLGSDVDVGPA